MPPSHVVRDVVHGYIEMDDDDRALVDVPIVQRLRYVRQNDVAHLVYPSLNTTRFEHSLGVFHLSGLLADSALNNCPDSDRAHYLKDFQEVLPKKLRSKRPEEVFCRAARWYGLLHDIGHLPFSHLTEYCLDKKHDALYPRSPFFKLHESAGRSIALKTDGELAEAMEKQPTAAWVVRQLLSHKSLLREPQLKVLQPLKDIVDGDVDADRIDATARDGLLSGGDYGHYDISRLSRHSVLYKLDGQWRVFFTTRSVSAVESLLVERCKTYRWIHYKPKVVAFKNAFRHCFASIPLRNYKKTWHADNYVQGFSYLDDSYVMAAISRLSRDVPEHVDLARAAILQRAKTASPLWKRRDEFRRLSDDVASGCAKLPGLNLEFPILNQLSPDSLQDLEDNLNKDFRRGEKWHFLVSKTQLTAYEPLFFDERVGQCWIISHKDREPIRLTNESRMVQSLGDVVKNEPAFGVTVIGPDSDFKREKVRIQKYFVEVARKLLCEILPD